MINQSLVSADYSASRGYLMLCFVCLMLSSPQASSSQSEVPESRSETTLQETPFNYCGDQPWLDDWYCHFNYGIESSVVGINNWFKYENKPSAKPPKASGRLRFGVEPRSGDLNQLDFRFKIRVKLPALQDRVELLLSDDEDEVNQQAVKAARNEQLGRTDQTTLALQFRDKPDSKIAYRIGLGRGSQIYTRARYKDAFYINDLNKISYLGEINYYSDDQIGAEVGVSLSQTVSKNEAIEFENTFRYRDKTEDILWRHQFQYLVLYDSKTSYLFTAMIDGLNKPSYRKEQVLMSLRYKRNVLRPWLFLEVEPFLLWLRSEGFRTSPGIALRLEVHFPNY